MSNKLGKAGSTQQFAASFLRSARRILKHNSMHEAKKIANYVISRKATQKFSLTNMRINKLIYFIHGWSFRKYENGFIRNHFEAWDYGPVIKTVYDELKYFSDREIDQYIMYTNYANGLREVIPFDDLGQSDFDFIDRVLDYYSSMRTAELVEMSHLAGGAWAKVRQSGSMPAASRRIPNDLIRDEFVGDLPVDKWTH